MITPTLVLPPYILPFEVFIETPDEFSLYKIYPDCRRARYTLSAVTMVLRSLARTIVCESGKRGNETLIHDLDTLALLGMKRSYLCSAFQGSFLRISGTVTSLVAAAIEPATSYYNTVYRPFGYVWRVAPR